MTTELEYAAYVEVPIEQLQVSAYMVPTDFPESDGTLQWDKTTMVLVEVSAEHKTGIGYTYADIAAATLIQGLLRNLVLKQNAVAPTQLWQTMMRETRNLGHSSLVAMAISAVDSALWDLKARLLNISLAGLLGAVRERVPIYGSGGFTSYSVRQLQEQLGNWAGQGIPRVKMKIGRDAEADIKRVRAAREAIGTNVELFVDANGAYSRTLALLQAEKFTEQDVSWFEEPVSSDDLEGLHFIRGRAPAGMDIAAGEYGFHLDYFEHMLDSGAVDVLQADVTRCGGITGLMQVASLCQARHIPLSAHCGPALHVHPCCAILPFRHLEYFHDHVRIERTFFNGLPALVEGHLQPDFSRPGNGLEFKRADVKAYSI
jgi:L-alanine-DL-glutamate epimerase-like enolase superfamily enzyme